MSVIFTELAAFIAVLKEYNIYLLEGKFWTLILALSVVVLLAWAAACRAAASGEKNLLAVYAGMLLVAGLYSYAAALFFNCEYDHQPEVIWRVGIDGKHINHGKTTTYYLELSPWGRFENGKNVQVSSSIYRGMRTGDSVSVHLRPGKWGIPWYEVHRY